jgi:methionine--tRNA ligase beta chain
LIRLRSNSSRGLRPRSRNFATAGFHTIMNISFEEFKKLRVQIGLIVEAERVEGTDKLLKLQVDFGSAEQNSEKHDIRQIVSGIAQFYKPEQLIGKQFPFVTNLEPRVIRGVESQGMILGISSGEKVVLLKPQKKVLPGSIVG